MTSRHDLLDRVRAANPVPVPLEPDWERIIEHVRSDQSIVSGSDSSQALRRGHRSRAATRHREPRLARAAMIGTAASAAMAAGLLLAIAPWSQSTDFLARAAVALTPGTEAVLYERWETVVSPEPGSHAYPNGATFGPDQLWVEGGQPHHYRVALQPNDSLSVAGAPVRGLGYVYGLSVMSYVGRGLNLATGENEQLADLQRTLAGRPLELGGASNPGAVQPTLTFLPSNQLLSSRLEVALGASLPGSNGAIVEDGADPVGTLRSAIAEGRAREAGSTQLNGRTVMRINFDLPTQVPADAPPMPSGAPTVRSEAYAYVEANNFHPVEITFGRWSYRFLTYEYLPATAKNRALTDIREQHATAKIVTPGSATEPGATGSAK